jgi:replicative DNA helicase
MSDYEVQVNDSELEELVIISLLKSPDTVKDYLLGVAREELFYSFWWKEIYCRIRNLTKDKGKLPNDVDILHDPVISTEAKMAIKSSLVFLDNGSIQDHDRSRSAINQLTEKLRARKLCDIHKNLGQSLTKNTISIKDIVQTVSDKLCEINTDTEDFVSSILKLTNEEESDKLVDKILSKRDNVYIPTGFTLFDQVNKGLPRGGLTLLAATTGGGKSLTALHMAKAQAEAGFRVCIVSLEMDEFELMERRFSSVTNLSLTRLKNIDSITLQEREAARQAFASYRNKIKAAGGTEDYKCKMNNLTIEELLYGLKPFNYDVIIIDYLGLLKGVDGDDQWRKLSEAARFCKMFAADNSIQIIALAQLDKEGEVRYSKGMLEHANNSFSWVCGRKEKERGIIEVEQKKARMAEAFPFYLRLNFNNMTVSSLTQEEQRQHMESVSDPKAGAKKYESKRTTFFGD